VKLAQNGCEKSAASLIARLLHRLSRYRMKFNIIRVFSYTLLVSVLIMIVYVQSDLSKLTMAELPGSDFNFVTAGDWGCKNDAKNTFNMKKKGT
jgi:hypothetical protein